ncbi:glycosyltransferase family 64 C5-like [Chlorella sorokiniana]|uniref:Glycosyltransferase family 64 C5-like n=1 Tax=Chlorella sorokiniana TaxID=3076 RepID=A0A2P6TT66_CHLSO|nr:glycosyltransferase family 64 C5-like [Chlorella sorokiniana]|eukprot:PRW57258.1 glycosyltransferase family 64 C5-like [Chlorella sorokiniana]
MRGERRPGVGRGRSGALAAVAAVAAAALGNTARPAALGSTARPVLPLHKAAKPSPPAAKHGKPPRQISSRQVWRAAALLALAALLAAAAAAAAVGWYATSILHERPEALAAAMTEVQAAVSGAAAGTAAAPEQEGGNLLAGNYTVVVMSYIKRLSTTLPYVVNHLGNCPSASEVLLVWNGNDPPAPSLFNTRAPVRVRAEAKNDLSNRVRPDGGIRTAAVLLADDDLLLPCADVERAFAKWQANQQAIVGFFPRLTSPGPPPQYLGERHVFRQMQYNTVLTGFAFVSRRLLDLYWADRYAQGRAHVLSEKNCEDILFNYAAAAAIQEGSQLLEPQQQGGAAELQPHAVWSQPSRRLDISFVSGVGISKSGGIHEAKRRRCVQLFSQWYGDILRPQPVRWDQRSATWRLLLRPACWLPTGCLYL